VCVIDTDRSSAVWDGFDHVERILEVLSSADHDRASARVARRRMRRAGLQEITALPATATDAMPGDRSGSG
jgi:hypothetical protein